MFLSYEEQVENLKKNGLIIEDEHYAISYLKKEGYYNLIKGYSRSFKSNNKYFKNTKFEEICFLYSFDKNLNSIIYKYTSKIENNIKAILAHNFSEKYGHDHNKYLDKKCFTEDDKKEIFVSELIEMCNKTIIDGCNKNKKRYKLYIWHHFNNYKKVPLWVLIRALTFGNVSIFIGLLKEEDKETIANEYNLDCSELVNMLEMLVQFRNIVAHGEMLFCAKLEKLRLNSKMPIFNNMSIPTNKTGDPLYGRRDFLSLLIILKYFLDPISMIGVISEVENELDILQRNINNTVFGIVKKEMGLKGSWKKLPIIKGK